MNINWRILIGLCFILLMNSCSKEENEIKLAEVNVSSSNFDNGHLLILLKGSPGVVDSIIYTNETKGFSNTVNKVGLSYSSGNNLSILSKPLLNGNNGDQVKCCVYLNTSSEIGIAFDTTLSTLQTPMTPPGKLSQSGVY